MLSPTEAATAEPVEEQKEALAGLWNDIVDYFSDPDRWVNWSVIALRIFLILIIARIAIRILNQAVKHMAEEKNRLRVNPRRTKTIVRLMGNMINYAINFVMILLILDELGVKYGPILAGAGVLGLAIGFGAQSFVKDVITGFSIIFEDQFAVGDVIQTRTFKGTVEEIGLRVTRIRSWTGEVHFIPNGSIVEVTNYSLNNSIAVVDVVVARSRDIDKALELIKETARRVKRENDDVIKEPTVLGVQTVTPAEVTIRVTCECKPNKQDAVTRALNEEIKKSLDGSRDVLPVDVES